MSERATLNEINNSFIIEKEMPFFAYALSCG